MMLEVALVAFNNLFKVLLPTQQLPTQHTPSPTHGAVILKCLSGSQQESLARSARGASTSTPRSPPSW